MWERKSVMQYKEVAGGICAPKGFAAAGVHCGIRANHSEKYDLALIKAEVRCAAAGVYTTNKVCGAPIKVDRAHLADGYAQAIVVNSGNANTCAAADGKTCCFKPRHLRGKFIEYGFYGFRNAAGMTGIFTEKQFSGIIQHGYFYSGAADIQTYLHIKSSI